MDGKMGGTEIFMPIVKIKFFVHVNVAQVNLKQIQKDIIVRVNVTGAEWTAADGRVWMSKKKIFRKPSPQPPNWFWWDIDNCWDCNCDHKGCRNCKRLKEMRKIERDKRERKEKQKIQSYY